MPATLSRTPTVEILFANDEGHALLIDGAYYVAVDQGTFGYELAKLGPLGQRLATYRVHHRHGQATVCNCPDMRFRKAWLCKHCAAVSKLLERW